jgi:hypothetical protein
MSNDPDWLEYARLAVSTLTPIMTGIIGIILVRMGTRLDVSKQLHQELLRKRLQLFEEVAPKLNDMLCFFQAIGHWAELSPPEIIKRKRAVDRSVQVNRYLFRSDFWDAYQRFEQAHFEMYAAVGRPAKLRLDMTHIHERVGDSFKNEWTPFISSQPADHEDQRKRYEALMEILGREIKGL